VSGRAVTTLGVPLDDKRFSGPGASRGPVLRGVVLEAFTAVPDAPQLRALPVLDEDAAPWAGREAGPQALSDLVTRRAERSGGLLHRSMPELDASWTSCCGGWPRRETMTALAHGDLIPANILVDDNLHPWRSRLRVPVHRGRPAFDAAVTASVYDMYSPAAARPSAVSMRR